MTPRTAAGKRLLSGLEIVPMGSQRSFASSILAIEEEAAQSALIALRAEVVKLDDLRRDAGSAEAMNHRILALIDAALEPAP